MNYTLQQLKTFECVAKHKSVTKASEELNLTQPAVSIQLRKFQDQFEIPLTEIIGRQLFLTNFGESVLILAKEILARDEKIKYITSQHKGLLTGSIHISVVSTGKYVIPYYLADFMKKHPEIDISIDVTNRNEVLDNLKNNNTDIALVSILPEDINLNKIELLTNTLCLVASPKHYNEHYKKNTKNYLHESVIIQRERGSATKQKMDSFLSSKNINPIKKTTLVSNEAVKQAVIAGLGISILSLNGLKNELKNNDIKIIDMKGLPIKTTWHMVSLENKEHSPAVEEFLKSIQLNNERIKIDHFNWLENY